MVAGLIPTETRILQVKLFQVKVFQCLNFKEQRATKTCQKISDSVFRYIETSEDEEVGWTGNDTAQSKKVIFI